MAFANSVFTALRFSSRNISTTRTRPTRSRLRIILGCYCQPAAPRASPYHQLAAVVYRIGMPLQRVRPSGTRALGEAWSTSCREPAPGRGMIRGVTQSALVAIALAVFGWAVVSEWLAARNVTGPLILMAAGFVLANPDWGVVTVNIDS